MIVHVTATSEFLIDSDVGAAFRWQVTTQLELVDDANQPDVMLYRYGMQRRTKWVRMTDRGASVEGPWEEIA